MSANRGPQAFEHESLQSTESIVRHLEALTEGIRRGRLVLSSGEEEEPMVLTPEGLISLSIKASRKDGRDRLGLRIEWHERRHEAGDAEQLVIRSTDGPDGRDR